MLRRRLLSDDNILWLYRNGDECMNVTGGWVKAYQSSGSNGTFTKNASDIYMEASSTGYNSGGCGCCTNNSLSFSGFSKIVIELTMLKDRTTYNPSDLCGGFRILSSTSSSSGYIITGKSGRYASKKVGSLDSVTSPQLLNDGTQQLHKLIYLDIVEGFSALSGYLLIYSFPVSGGVGFSKLGLAK